MEAAAETTDLSLGPSLSALEQRVQKLEETVGALQNTKILEERIVDRLSRREEAARAAEQFTPAHAPSEPTVYSLGPTVTASAWIVFELITDIKNMFLMFFDMRFRMSWSTRIVTFVLLPLMLTANWWFPPAWITLIGFPIVSMLNLLLSFVLFKFLSRDAQRYREFKRNG
jgi:hypothetical protein